MRVAYAFLLLSAIVGSSHASVIEYESEAAWASDTGTFTTITFQGFPANTIITNQYADQGVIFTDGTDRIFFSNSFVNDGVGLNGALDEINLSFTEPMYSIGVDFPGSLTISLYWQGELTYTSSDFITGGEDRFSGLISTKPFDAALLIDPLGGLFIDDLYFGPPIPAPGALALLLLAAVPRTTRRRYP